MSITAGPAKTGRTTITDVARAAGVSVATVSKVINGRDGIAVATSARVMQVVDKLGYERSLVATSLRQSKTNVIGVLVAEFEPFALQLLQGISDALSDTQYDVLVYAGAVSVGNHRGWENRSLSRLGGTLIDAAILVTPTLASPDASIPLVAIDPHTGSGGPATIDGDNLSGARAATEHLISLGHTRVGHLRGRDDLESAHVRERGYREAMHDAGLPIPPTFVTTGGYRADDANSGAVALLDAEVRPTAVFAANDVSAIELIRVAHERGLRVPEDLSIVGFDDIPDAASASPALTTVRQPLREMGAAAVEAIIEMLQGKDTSAHMRLPTRLVVRASTAPPA
ncbi:LacI family DNA-binding transcriptional regulator [Microbacterium amylolyticum]|uniref:LacI family transcriptional regulator n=1 Tax=Microbacterium amylolyticum TaxID=936337 RepID=A0ABS4ZKZ5_9MICO|nr:LacI family DNA-binding transcriptional regulator [Microbacterium amylolyticum]MBP2437625.1 LacI family transcriptional regulator [Microbacterium amylolyticum]